MDFECSPKVMDLRVRVDRFMQAFIYPNEARYHQDVEGNTHAGRHWTPPRIIEELKPRAQAAGLWDLFLLDSRHGAGLSNLEYAPLAELMGRVPWASEVFNCSAPDTGNMEPRERYGSPEPKARWLTPLLTGEIRSAFAMTEPEVASSDATHTQTCTERDGDDFPLAYTLARTLRLADGPAEVHRNALAKMELARWLAASGAADKIDIPVTRGA